MSGELGDLTADCLETCEQFYQQAHGYLADRESELIDVIELLRQTMATVSRGSLGYEKQIEASTERLTHSARLGDLAALRSAIQEEVESIKNTTEERRDAEAGRPVVLVLLDIDDFKQINEAHGLTVGDRVLLCIAEHLSETLRPDDVARFGDPESPLGGRRALEYLEGALPDTQPDLRGNFLPSRREPQGLKAWT